MTNVDDKIKRAVPRKLMGSFSQNKVLFCFVAAVAVHVLVIGASSLDYVYYKWINPEAGLAQDEAAKKAREERASGVNAGAPVAPATNALDRTSTTNAGPETEEGDSAALLEERRNTPVVKSITELPEPDEIPDVPDDIGLTVEDTNQDSSLF